MSEIEVMYKSSYFADLDAINEFKNTIIEFRDALKQADLAISNLFEASKVGSLDPSLIDIRLRIEKMIGWAKSIRIATMVIGQNPTDLYLGYLDKKKICCDVSLPEYVWSSRKDIRILHNVYRLPSLKGGEIDPSYGPSIFVDQLTEDSLDRCLWVDDNEDWHSVIRRKYTADKFSWARLPLVFFVRSLLLLKKKIHIS